MKVTVSRKSLSEGLTIASRFATSRAQLPILGNILFEAVNNKLNISATNLEMSVSLSIASKIEKEGKITVPAKVIYELVSNLNSESVSIDVEKEQIFIKSENFSSRVSGINASDFPFIPNVLGKNAMNLDPVKVTSSIAKVIYSVSSDETRPTLTGILLIFIKDNLSYVATDGFRLSKKDVPFKNTNPELKIILPKGVLVELERLTSDEKVLFEYKKDDEQVVFKIGEIVLSSRIIEGEFPDFEKIIPRDSKLNLEVDKNDLMQGIKLASVFARDASNVVRFLISEKLFTITAESSQVGSQENNIDAKIKCSDKQIFGDGKEFIIAFNYKFIEDFLNSVDGNDLEILLNDANSPGVFRDLEDKDFLHLIMPVRI
jgi:DNA polymerase-3 subunit beta